MSTNSAQLAADIAQLHTDAGLMHNVIHGDAATTVMTNGGIVPSVAKAVNAIAGFTLRGAWATGTLYNFKDVYTDGTGLTYMALVTHTSTTISADQAAGKVAVYQGIPPSEFTSRIGRVIDSISALRGISKSAYNRCFVTGYYGAGDGGGGSYWYDPTDTAVLPTPTSVSLSAATTGGTLAAGTYYYRVSAIDAYGETLASAEISVTTTGTTSTVTVNWSAVAGATGYKIYGRATGAELFLAKVGAVTSWTDAGSITPAGALPAGYKKDNGGTNIEASDGGRWKLLGGVVTFKTFGARGNSNGTTGNGADDTLAVQAALTAVGSASFAYKLGMDEGIFRCTGPLNITAGLTLEGQGASPYVASPGTIGAGSWLYFDHTGQGITIQNSTQTEMSGVRLLGFGSIRNQPSPAAGWGPAANDYDIYINNADVYIDEVLLLNPTSGVYLTNGGAGRLEIGTLRGQAFNTMVRINASYDVVRIQNLHQWTFWRDDTNVHAYTKANLDVLYLERCDNPMFGNLFSIFARSGMRFGQNANGRTLKFKLANADFDRGKYGVWVDSTVTSGVIGQISNLTHQGETGLAGSEMLRIDGAGNMMDMGSIRTDLCGTSAIDLQGANNTVRIGTAGLYNYNQDATGAPAVNVVTNNNTVDFAVNPIISSGTKYSSTGNIFTDDWRSWTPTIIPQSGTITTLGTVTAVYQQHNGKVTFNIVINITTNGNGAGTVNFTLPIPPAADSQATGRETLISGKGMHVSISASNSTAVISAADNTYPGANGAKIVCSGSYQF
jgi:hypothetical protein